MPPTCTLGQRPRRDAAPRELDSGPLPLPVLFQLVDVSRPRSTRTSSAAPPPPHPQAPADHGPSVAAMGDGPSRPGVVDRVPDQNDGPDASRNANVHAPSGRAQAGVFPPSDQTANASDPLTDRTQKSAAGFAAGEARPDSSSAKGGLTTALASRASSPASSPSAPGVGLAEPAVSATEAAASLASPPTSAITTAASVSSSAADASCSSPVPADGTSEASASPFPTERGLAPDPLTKTPAPSWQVTASPTSSMAAAVGDAESSKPSAAVDETTPDAAPAAAETKIASKAERPPATEEWIVTHARFIALAFLAALIGTIYLARSHRRAASRPHAATKSQAVEPTIEIPSAAPVEAAGGSVLPAGPAAGAAQSVLRPADTSPPVATAEPSAPAGAVLGVPSGVSRSSTASTAPAADPLFVFPSPRSTAAAGRSPTSDTPLYGGEGARSGSRAAASPAGSSVAVAETPFAPGPGRPMGSMAGSAVDSYAGVAPRANVPAMPEQYPASAIGSAGSAATAGAVATAPAAGIANPYVNSAMSRQSRFSTGAAHEASSHAASGLDHVNYPVTSPAGTAAPAAGAYGVLPVGGSAADPAGGRQAAPTWSANPPVPAASGAGSWVPPASYPTTATRENRHERIGSGNY